MEEVTFPKLGLSFNISRVAFSIGDFDVYWYGLLIGIGMILAIIYALRHCKMFGVDQNKLMDVVIVGVIFAIIGARAYYVIFTPRDTYSSFWEIIDIRNGGMAFYGAVIGGVFGGWLMTRFNHAKPLPIMDMAGIGFLIGQGIGRWGNFFNQECFGVSTYLPWGMYSESIQRYISTHAEEIAAHGMTCYQYTPVHPTFLYESIWCILGFILLSIYAKHRKFDGEIFLMFLLWNGSLRMFVEGLRTDSLYIGDTNIRVSQLLAAIMAFGSLAALIIIRNKQKASGDPDYLKPYGMTEEWAEEYARIQEKENASRKKKKKNKAEETVTEEEAAPAETEEAAAENTGEAAAGEEDSSGSAESEENREETDSAGGDAANKDEAGSGTEADAEAEAESGEDSGRADESPAEPAAEAEEKSADTSGSGDESGSTDGEDTEDKNS
ncbi:MAG: prolipoprotein diacylglyceryl transferase [Oscillospiraceae bacterium]|jgi:phosphatidylglycerol:prolipoprotein diacylglycerol transferase